MVLPLLPLTGMISAVLPFVSVSIPASISVTARIVSSAVPFIADLNTSHLFSSSHFNNKSDPSDTRDAEENPSMSASCNATGLGMNGADGTLLLKLFQYMPERPPHFSEHSDETDDSDPYWLVELVNNDFMSYSAELVVWEDESNVLPEAPQELDIEDLIVQALWVAGPLAVGALVPGAAPAMAVFSAGRSAYDIYNDGFTLGNGLSLAFAGLTLASPAFDGVVDAAGFGKAGVRAKSLASGFQSSNYGGAVPAGGYFSQLQSYGATRKNGLGAVGRTLGGIQGLLWGSSLEEEESTDQRQPGECQS